MTSKRQHANLWGQATGQLNQKTADFICEVQTDEHGKPYVSIEQKGTKKIISIPSHVEVHLFVRNRLRLQRFTCGTRGDTTNPEDSETGTALLDGFTDNESVYGAAKWFVKYVEPGNEGRTWAWTDPKRLIPTKTTLSDDHGNALLKISTDHQNVLGHRPWKVSLEDEEHPTILVNNASDTLREKLETRNEISVLLMPQVCGAVLDKLLEAHLEDPVSIDGDDWKSRWYKWAFARVETELPIYDDETEPYALFAECQAWKHTVIDWLNKKLEAAAKVEEYLTEGTQ